VIKDIASLGTSAQWATLATSREISASSQGVPALENAQVSVICFWLEMVSFVYNLDSNDYGNPLPRFVSYKMLISFESQELNCTMYLNVQSCLKVGKITTVLACVYFVSPIRATIR